MQRSPGRGPAARVRLSVVAVLIGSLLSGCATVVSSAAGGVADSLSGAIMNSRDPETVAAALPAYLLLIDGLVADAPEDPQLLRAAATLHGSFAANFVDDPQRAAHMHDRALDLALRAWCVEDRDACDLRGMDHDDFAALVAEADDADALYVLGSSWAGLVRSRSDDWNAIAELGRVRLLFERVVEIDETLEHGGAHLYLGALDTMLPPALGGRPEDGRAHFRRALEISDQRHLTAKVMLAESYARMVFDRRLHDRLLEEVLAADPEAPGLTLANVLAQRDARALLASADDYFQEIP